MDISSFQKIIWEYYHTFGRHDMPWRKTREPYHIVISEVMLQQTQVARVMQKYKEWLEFFPTFEALANADLIEVLRLWQGMGYNRRGKYLYELAKIVVEKYGSKLPDDPKILQTFPGLGYATANSIIAFTFNKPVVFIETNIRRVFIHFFFQDKEGVSDKDLFPLVEQAVDQKNPREWYYALMDYGVKLAKEFPNPNRRSKHYVKQSKFEGSDRQIRGEILRKVLEKNITSQDIVESSLGDKERIDKIIQSMEKEGFLVQDKKGTYTIKK